MTGQWLEGLPPNHAAHEEDEVNQKAADRGKNTVRYGVPEHAITSE